MCNNSCVVSRCTSNLASVSSLLLEVAHDGSLGHVADRHNVADGQLGLASTVDELAGVHTLGGDEELLLDLVSVGIPEVGYSQGSSTARVVDDIFYHSLNKQSYINLFNQLYMG